MKLEAAPRDILGEILELRIEHFGSRGEGLARYQDESVFVSKTVPGDLVRVEIESKKKSRYQARLIEVIEEGSSRQKPSCKHFNECGGCDLQQLPYKEQIKWKQKVLSHWLERSRLASLIGETQFDLIESPKKYAYRHRVHMSLGENKTSFKRARSHTPVELEECPVLESGFFKALKELSSKTPEPLTQSYSYSEDRIVEAEASYEIDDLTLSYDANCFTQPNMSVNKLMWKRIKEDVLKLKSSEFALDLFSGIGNFSFPMSKLIQKVVGVESSSDAAEWAQRNAERLGLTEHVDIYNEDVNSFLMKLEKTSVDFVLMDPPRSGIGAGAKLLKKIKPERLTFVSCQLDSLIRDLGVFLKNNDYRVERWTLVDLLPQTKHIESIVSLRKD